MANQLVSGKLAFVTGAGSGIGKAVCQVLAKEGATIVAADKNISAAKDTIQNIERSTDHLAVSVDVSVCSSVNGVFKQIIKHFNKPPTVVVNSAGITRDNFILKMDEESFQEVIDVNLKGTFLVMQAAARMLIEANIANGSIINLASIVGQNGNIGQANYAASKAGVEALTKTAAKEFGKFGIRCNAVVPGFIATPMTEKIPDKVKEMFRKNIPLERFGNPEEIAEVISFLASDKSSFVNGASFNVTGG